MTLAISFADIEVAAARIAGHAYRTPVLTSRTFDQRTGARVFFKAENLQRMGAFKFRGAFNALAQFSPEQRERGVLAFSSGNHAQAVALAARILGMPSVIVMPRDAPAAKLAATREYQEGQSGSEIVLYDRYREDRDEIGRKLATEREMTLVPPYDYAPVMAGQGTAALELIEDTAAGGPLDLLVVCVGGGGLLSGCAVAAKHLCPEIEVWGVEPAAGNDVQQSLARGEIVKIDTPDTIADGAQTQSPGRLTFPVIQALVTGIVTATDDELIAALQFLAERMKVVVEPTGALGAAAVANPRSGLPDLRGKRVGVLLSGGNVDRERYADFLGRTAPRS